MMALTARQIAHIVGGRVVAGDPGSVYRHVSIDSRNLSSVAADVAAQTLFVALKGPRFDGHDFIEAAYRLGARGVIASAPAPTAPGAPTWIEVADTQLALEMVGRAARDFHPGRVVAVTGSVGKTTMKDMIAAALEADAPGRVGKTPGNLNNHLGLPLTLAATTGDERWLVLELGMSAPGEIARLTHMARPEVGVVTRAAAAHLAFFDSVDAIADAKAELWEHLPARATAVCNADDARLLARVGRRPQVTYGVAPSATVRLVAARHDDAGLVAELATPQGPIVVTLAAVGQHTAHNAAGALAAVHALGLPLGPAAAALGAGFRPGKHRLERMELGGVRVLDDCYNANPASMRAALETFEVVARDAAIRVALLGSMRELGPEADALHREIGHEAARRGVTRLFATGAHAAALAEGARAAGLADVVTAEDVGALLERLADALPVGAWLLLKGSRGEALERALAALGERGVAGEAG
ncbi:MAG: UDP-N-acetylmuramoyl-tripeptide--D-alanyl-D-alanine ligase [Deltaproteobacteria bacterium]|nr:UDP-N-acetylmuramoyl-tripeptide--D-alanyl-D-alanine ligase [Deltaproteobacteria bacterium]